MYSRWSSHLIDGLWRRFTNGVGAADAQFPGQPGRAARVVKKEKRMFANHGRRQQPAASSQQPAPFFVLTYIYRLCETHRVSTSAMGFDELIRVLVMATACTNGRLIRQREELRQVAKRLTTYA